MGLHPALQGKLCGLEHAGTAKEKEFHEACPWCHGARECCIVGTQTAGLALACMYGTNRLCVNGHDLALPVEAMQSINSCLVLIRLSSILVMGSTVVPIIMTAGVGVEFSRLIGYGWSLIRRRRHRKQPVV